MDCTLSSVVNNERMRRVWEDGGCENVAVTLLRNKILKRIHNQESCHHTQVCKREHRLGCQNWLKKRLHSRNRLVCLERVRYGMGDEFLILPFKLFHRTPPRNILHLHTSLEKNLSSLWKIQQLDAPDIK